MSNKKKKKVTIALIIYVIITGILIGLATSYIISGNAEYTFWIAGIIYVLAFFPVSFILYFFNKLP